MHAQTVKGVNKQSLLTQITTPVQFEAAFCILTHTIVEDEPYNAAPSLHSSNLTFIWSLQAHVPSTV